MERKNKTKKKERRLKLLKSVMKQGDITNDLREMKRIKGNTVNNCMPTYQMTQMKQTDSWKDTAYNTHLRKNKKSDQTYNI